MISCLCQLRTRANYLLKTDLQRWTEWGIPLKITSLHIIQIDQHIVMIVYMKKGKLSCYLRLSTIKQGSVELGNTSCRMDQHAHEKGQWNRRWARSSSTLQWQSTRLESSKCIFLRRRRALVLSRSFNTSQKRNFLLFRQAERHNHLNTLWTCLWSILPPYW